MLNRISFNTAVQVVSRVLELGSALIVNAWLARQWGSVRFGEIGFYAGLSGVLIFMFDFGLGNLLIRAIATQRQQARQLLANGLVTLIPFCLLGTVSVVAIGCWLKGAGQLWLLLMVATHLILIAIFLLLRASFHAYERMELESMAVFFERLSWIATGIWLGTCTPSITAYFAFFTLCKLLSVLAASLLFAKYILPHSEKAILHLATQWDLVKRTIPFGLSWAFSCICISSDLVILSYQVGGAETGYYRAAGTLILPLSYFAATLNNSLLPRMSVAAMNCAKDEFDRYCHTANRIVLLAAMPITVFVWLFSHEIIAIFFGPSYAAAVPLLQLLSLIVPLRFLNQSIGMVFTAFDRQDQRMVAYGIAAAFNVGVNLWVIGRWGAIGACMTTLATDLLVLILLWLQARAMVGTKGFADQSALVSLLVAGLILVPMAWAGIPAIASGVLLVILYPLLLVHWRIVSPHETQLIWKRASQ